MSADAGRSARDWAAQIVALADEQLLAPPPPLDIAPPPATHMDLPVADTPKGLAWGAKVSPAFRARVLLTGQDFAPLEPNWLMACMAFETGRSFDPAKRNPRSTATGLIQFMEKTARNELNTTTSALALMTAEDQFSYVWLYLRNRIRQRGPIRSLGDCYMSILNPVAMGKPDDYAMWVKGSDPYAVNAGLDADQDHVITKAEASAKVAALLAEGLKPENIG